MKRGGNVSLPRSTGNRSILWSARGRINQERRASRMFGGTISDKAIGRQWTVKIE